YIIIPSTWEEPFGLVALEGLACGCIPIASNGGGLPEAIGKTGIIFQSGSIESLTNSLKKLYSNTLLQEQFLKAIPNHLNGHHSKKIADKYIQAIENHIINKK
ncbi:unnamed protein product, partial [Ectocarpus sp. 12 AP-2014]